MARLIADAGGAPFIDVYDIKKGDRIEERIREGIGECRELVVLLTRSSLESRWVYVEIGAVWGQGKRIVGVLHGVSIDEIEKEFGGMACLRSRNVIALNEFEDYIHEMCQRINEGEGA